jgi:hypothetical protein
MSIAEMINQGTERQSQSWSVLSQNLSRLGQQVGQQLAMREYQKQAAEALPAMQAAYRSAMEDVGRGQTAEGYKKFMDAQFQFGTSQNPFISQANEAAGTIFTNAATIREKQEQRKAQYGGGGQVYEVPSMAQLVSGETIRPRAVLPAFEVGTEDIIPEGGQPAGQPTATLLPKGQPLQGTPAQRAMQEADRIDQENAANLPKQEPSQGESPFELGFTSGSVSRYVASEKDRKKAAEALMDAVKATPDQRKATIKSITEETEVIPENALSVNGMPGFGDGYFVGPSMERPQKVISQKITEKFTRKGPESERSEEVGQAELTDAQKSFQEAMRTFGAATSMFRYNPQLAKIMEAAGGDPTKIQVSDDVVETEDGKTRTVYSASVNNMDLGELSTQVPLGPDGKQDDTALSEYSAVITMIGAPDLVSKFGGKFIPAKKPAAAQPATGGLPAVQAQAPAAPEIPEEAAGLQQIVAQGQAAKAGEQAKATEKSIKDIDAEIKRLSPTTAGPQTRLQSEGLMPQKQKTPEQAQADIQKITNLKAEKELLVAKSEGRVFNTVEEAKASKKKFPSGTIIYIGGKPAKVK